MLSLCCEVTPRASSEYMAFNVLTWYWHLVVRDVAKWP